jgi:hypothetical protein
VGTVNVGSRAPTCPYFIVTLCERRSTTIQNKRLQSERGSDRFLNPEITFLTRASESLGAQLRDAIAEDVVESDVSCKDGKPFFLVHRRLSRNPTPLHATALMPSSTPPSASCCRRSNAQDIALSCAAVFCPTKKPAKVTGMTDRN